jgi:hypothetical protein
VSISNARNQLHWLNPHRFDCFLVQNEHTTGSPGRSVWRAILADQPHQLSRLHSSGYPMPLPLLSVSALPEESPDSA